MALRRGWVSSSPAVMSTSLLCLSNVGQEFVMETSSDRPVWKRLLAFGIIYFVWGSTFLAIRVGVREVPPFVLAAMRFLVAGLALYGWMLARGERSPKPREWASATLLALIIFVFDY